MLPALVIKQNRQVVIAATTCYAEVEAAAGDNLLLFDIVECQSVIACHKQCVVIKRGDKHWIVKSRQRCYLVRAVLKTYQVAVSAYDGKECTVFIHISAAEVVFRIIKESLSDDFISLFLVYHDSTV